MTPAASALHHERADWLRVLARSGADELERIAAPVLADYRFETLRAPEIGLTMVRARIGNRGDRFNLGEATLTRCAVRHRGSDGQVTVVPAMCSAATRLRPSASRNWMRCCSATTCARC